MMKILKTPLIWRCQNSCSWTTAAAVLTVIAMDPGFAETVGAQVLEEGAAEEDVHVIVPISVVVQNSVIVVAVAVEAPVGVVAEADLAVVR